MENVIIKNGFGFKLSDDKQKLFAFTVPTANKIELSSSSLKQDLIDENCTLYIDDFLLSEFISRFQAKKKGEQLEAEIGYVKDATCEILIHSDKMKASLWLVPSFGGEKITLQDIKYALTKHGVTFGIVSDDVLTELVNREEVSNVTIAKGIPPINGVDSQFISLLPEKTEKAPVISDDENAIVDYRELGDIFFVRDGDLLAEKIAATKGASGTNVLGEFLTQKEGAEKPLSSDDSTRLNPENTNQLLSAITGQPVITENSVHVNAVLSLNSIDLSTGNVRYGGSIEVEHNVENGMTVFSSKDIVINGDIINSKIECLGDLLVKGSVLGTSQLIVNGKVQIKKGVQGYKEKIENAESVSLESLTPRIFAANFIILGFAENFEVESDNNIVIEQHALNCKLMAENIEVGAKSKKASIAGGVAWATNVVKVPVVGNSASLPTKICVGLNPQIQTAIEETEELLEQNKKKQKNVQNTLAYLNQNYTPENESNKMKLNFILKELESQANIHDLELIDYKSQMKFIENPKIIIGQRVNIGTTIQIRKAFLNIGKVIAKSTFISDKGEVQLIKPKM